MPQEQVAKLKKRQWFSIIAPKQFENVVPGETLVYEPQAMLGKTLSHNLMNLTSDPKKQNISICFKITEVQGDKGMTSIIGYQIVPSSVKRFVRRNSEKMDLSFSCETADNVHVRIKPLVITKADIKGSTAAKLRNTITQFLIKAVKKISYNDLLNDLITHKLQSEMRQGFNKIYPLKVCEIRYLGIETGEGVKVAAPENVEPAAPETVEPAQEAKAENQYVGNR